MRTQSPWWLTGYAASYFLCFLGNNIDEIGQGDFSSLNATLLDLDLADNHLSRIPQLAFRALAKLRTLDLSGNNLIFINANAFDRGPHGLDDLNLAHNLLQSIPFVSLRPFRRLKLLDLRGNLITIPFDIFFKEVISLGTLILDDNNIKYLEAFAFQSFGVVNVTSLSGNPLRAIATEAFKDAIIREIYINHTQLYYFTEDAFKGQERSLRVLDLSHNNLTTIPPKTWRNHDFLQRFDLSHNRLMQIPNSHFNGFQFTLRDFDVSGPRMASPDVQDMGNMRNLRRLGMSIRKDKTLKSLDRVSIALDAFFGINRALVTLRARRGLRLDTIQGYPIRNLNELRELDFGSNFLHFIAHDAFRGLVSVEIIRLDHNHIEYVPNGVFDANQALTHLDMSFNDLSSIKPRTFSDLKPLKSIRLCDNKIERIHKAAFSQQVITGKYYPILQHMPLRDFLEAIHLQGNWINQLDNEAFQGLPRLQFLDLSYNRLWELNLDALDQVGTLGTLTLDASYNWLRNLTGPSHGSWKNYFNIKFFNVSHNNISDISNSYFEPLRTSLLCMDLSHNGLHKLTKAIAGGSQYLQELMLSHNRLRTISPDAFRGSESIQHLDLSYNQLDALPSEIFQDLRRLRVVHLQGNRIRNLPDELFKSSLEILDASNNLMTHFPDFPLQGMDNLRQLDLSHNEIRSLRSSELLQLTGLLKLNLAENKISNLEAGTFAPFHPIRMLDLSFNPLGKFTPSAVGILENLEDLNLAGASLESPLYLHLPREYLHLPREYLHLPREYLHLPREYLYLPREYLHLPREYLHLPREYLHLPREYLHLPREYLHLPRDCQESQFNCFAELLTLNVSYNTLNRLDSLGTYRSLRSLDLTNNSLIEVESNLWVQLPNLRHLRLAKNPVQKLLNNSLVGLQNLHTLDISDLDLQEIESGAFSSMSGLEELTISDFPKADQTNWTALLSIDSLRRLNLHMSSSELKPLFTDWPPKLSHLTLEGYKLTRVHPDVFRGLSSSSFSLTIRGTSLTSLPSSAFSSTSRLLRLSLDVRGGNFTSLGDPRVRPKWQTFPIDLTDIKVSGNPWVCDCGIGWVEDWLRHLSRSRAAHISDFRRARCTDGRRLTTAIQADLDCHSAAILLSSSWRLLLLALLISLLPRQLMVSPTLLTCFVPTVNFPITAHVENGPIFNRKALQVLCTSGSGHLDESKSLLIGIRSHQLPWSRHELPNPQCFSGTTVLQDTRGWIRDPQCCGGLDWRLRLSLLAKLTPASTPGKSDSGLDSGFDSWLRLLAKVTSGLQLHNTDGYEPSQGSGLARNMTTFLPGEIFFSVSAAARECYEDVKFLHIVQNESHWNVTGVNMSDETSNEAANISSLPSLGGPLLLLLPLLLAGAVGSKALSRDAGEPVPCREVPGRINLPCLCSRDAENGTFINCDGVVFVGDFPVLPFRGFPNSVQIFCPRNPHNEPTAEHEIVSFILTLASTGKPGYSLLTAPESFLDSSRSTPSHST
ncbi:unnamed protein product [Cyprideis torosa]|uniref:Uncharacterized protein n=1 Tax=Cyprideis torosa TaxID=163714 RepID=A0A7R8ZRQ1_9CRUS|nr:unnamed protein product [Cyprideis torosa]CAG0894533.1 unnamed protein product [Cyprideis torosa]